MSEKLHRKDISSADFLLLARFCRALERLEEDGDCLRWYLGEQELFLPVWFKSAGQWRLSRYKAFKVESIGIATIDFRRLCSYVNEKESVVIDALFRLSMLAAQRWQSVLDRPRFRHEFQGLPYRDVGCDEWACHTGFILEMRRTEGKFKQKEPFVDDEYWYSDDYAVRQE